MSFWGALVVAKQGPKCERQSGKWWERRKQAEKPRTEEIQKQSTKRIKRTRERRGFTRNKHRADTDELTTQRGKTRGINVQEDNQGPVRLTGEGESHKTWGNTTCHTRGRKQWNWIQTSWQISLGFISLLIWTHAIAMKRGLRPHDRRPGAAWGTTAASRICRSSRDSQRLSDGSRKFLAGDLNAWLQRDLKYDDWQFIDNTWFVDGPLYRAGLLEFAAWLPRTVERLHDDGDDMTLSTRGALSSAADITNAGRQRPHQGYLQRKESETRRPSPHLFYNPAVHLKGPLPTESNVLHAYLTIAGASAFALVVSMLMW